MLSNKRNGTLYIGVTSNLEKRIWEHKNLTHKGFAQKYGTILLVYYEQHTDMESAIIREKQLKKWYRKWKLRLIETKNPHWVDLSSQW